MHDDGGLAFPVHGGYEGDDPRNQIIGGGMTLRDYFAALAMQGIQNANGNCSIDEAATIIEAFNGPDGYLKHVAETAYSYADAMLEARK